MATYYISPTGDDDTGNGSFANPWKTVAYACANAQSTANDDIVCKDAGSYVVAATPSEFMFSGVTGRHVYGMTSDSSLYVFDYGAAISRHLLENIWTFEDIRFTNAKVALYYAPLFWLYSTGGVLTFNRCIFDNIEAGTGSLGWGGLISDADARYAGFNGTINVNSCLMYNLKSPAGWGGIKVFTAQLSTMTVNNCTIHASVGGAGVDQLYYIGDTYSGGTMTIKNSIVTCDSGNCKAGGGYGAYIASYSYCCVPAFPGLPAGTGNILSDPLLVDPVNGNFKLRPTSPCIGAGTII